MKAILINNRILISQEEWDNLTIASKLFKEIVRQMMFGESPKKIKK